MQLHTYKARSLAEALRLVRDELGPDASVLHTREVGSSLVRLFGGRMIEVTASAELAAPSRLAAAETAHPGRVPPAELQDFRRKIRRDLLLAEPVEASLVEQLAAARSRSRHQSPSLRNEIADRLRRAGVGEPIASRWLERLEAELSCDPDCHADRAADRLRQIVASELPIRGEIEIGHHSPTVVALVGPTGVGKTTTVAKLAAHFRVHERRSVALVTVDTYRIAAVEQLGTYAQIMDLPMEVVSTPREMAAVCERLSEHELILIDTAGRSPRDKVRLLELKTILAAAQPDETPLVLSSVADADSLQFAVKTFAGVGATSLILTKLDEVAHPAALVGWLASCRLPLCYTTHGQNVPSDIQPASGARLAEMVVSN